MPLFSNLCKLRAIRSAFKGGQRIVHIKLWSFPQAGELPFLFSSFDKNTRSPDIYVFFVHYIHLRNSSLLTMSSYFVRIWIKPAVLWEEYLKPGWNKSSRAFLLPLNCPFMSFWNFHDTFVPDHLMQFSLATVVHNGQSVICNSTWKHSEIVSNAYQLQNLFKVT